MPDAKTLVDKAVSLSGLNDYAGNFEVLGGGEINETFLLKGDQNNYILRIAKTPGLDNLIKEDIALELLNSVSGVPRKIFFDPNLQIEGCYWIIESQIQGRSVPRLSPEQFESLGKLLAQVHKVADPTTDRLNLWDQFLQSCRHFGTEESLLAYPHPQLQKFIVRLQQLIQTVQSQFDAIKPALIHGDATPSNILVQDATVGLIDWEFAAFSDPMREFSTIYYDDMEYNRGKWRIQITPDEKQALFSGYRAEGGELAEDRIAFWMNFDKVTAAIYLYWKLNHSGRKIPEEDRQQNQFDFEQLVISLEKNLSE